VQYVTVQYVTAQYVTAQYVTVQYVTVRYVTVQYVTAQYVTTDCVIMTNSEGRTFCLWNVFCRVASQISVKKLPTFRKILLPPSTEAVTGGLPKMSLKFSRLQIVTPHKNVLF
jgi:hypothetical protein